MSRRQRDASVGEAIHVIMSRRAFTESNRRWDEPRSLFGDLMVLVFLIVQCLDGAMTYLGVTRWGLGIEANPLVSAAVGAAGLGAGLAGAKLVAMGFGILLHLRQVHLVVALLTAFYIAAAIVPWTALFLTH
jgi:nitrate reductase gamma subunit